MKVGLVGIHYPRPEHRDEFIFRVRQAAEVLAATPGEDLGRAVGAPRREGGRAYTCGQRINALLGRLLRHLADLLV